MAGKLSSLLVICALLSNSQSNNLVRATFNTVSQGVVRIDLEKKYLDHFDNIQIEDRIDIDLMIDSPQEVDQNLLIESDEMNYTQLRELQRRHGVRQEQVMQLAQQEEAAAEANKNPKNNNMLQTEGTSEGQGTNTNKAHAHTAQLVSEHADTSEDNRDDLQLQVPLNSKNDAVYLGTVYMGSPISQPSRVVFDTGSEYLAITSVLCDDETAGNYKFKKYDPLQGGFVQRDQNHKRCKTMSYDMHKSDSNKILSKASSKLTYGSAKLQGFIW